MTTTVAVSEENHYLLSRVKERGRFRSIDDTISALLQSGLHRVEQLWSERAASVRPVCRRYGIVGLTAYGSRVWGAAHSGSDVDLVAEFSETPSAFRLMEAQDALAEAFGAAVDLTTWGGLRPRLADRVRRQGVRLLG